MIYDAVDIAYYRNSTVTSKTKSIQASNDPFHFLKKEADLFSDQDRLNKYPRVVMNVYSHLYEDYSMCTNNLGRVMLLDNTTHEILRMWKGFRDASCYFLTNKIDTKTICVH